MQKHPTLLGRVFLLSIWHHEKNDAAVICNSYIQDIVRVAGFTVMPDYKAYGERHFQGVGLIQRKSFANTFTGSQAGGNTLFEICKETIILPDLSLNLPQRNITQK